MNDKNFNRIKVILAEKNLPNKYLGLQDLQEIFRIPGMGN